MSSPDSPLDHSGDRKPVSREVDLGLEISDGFSAASLFPGDRILRLHPNWFILDFEGEDGRFKVRLKDYATEKEFSLSGRLNFPGQGNGLPEIILLAGFDIHITFFRKDKRLQVRVESPEELSPENPILLWIRAIREYLRIYLKKTPATLFWRLIMNRIILTMNPSQRKICLMIARFTLLEVLVIILIVVGYFIFVL